MKNSRAQIARTTIVLLTVMSFLFSLTPRVPAKPTAPAAKRRQSEPQSPSDTKLRASDAYGKLPLSFEANRGQSDSRVKYLSRGQGYTVFLTATEAVFALRSADSGTRNEGHDDQAARLAGTNQRQQATVGNAKSATLRMQLVGANSEAQVRGEDALKGKVNYLTGSDRAKWHTDVPTYRLVHYNEVWPGIDMLWYGNQRQPEYDFIVRPGSIPSAIRISFTGVERMSLDGKGNLLLETEAGTLTQKAPEIYQETERGRQIVDGRYVVIGEHEVGFEVGAYDTSKPLTIDPQLRYATFYGGTGSDIINDIAADSAGNTYLTGTTLSADLVLENPFQSAIGNPTESAFIVKLNAAGSDIAYATYLGGSDQSTGESIAVTSDGKACLTGDTNSTNSNFPITSNHYQGNSSLFFDRGIDVFVTMLTAAGNGLVYSTFLGGSNADGGVGIAVDGADNIYVTGDTLSRNFPTKNASQRNPDGGGRQAFVSKFDTSQSGNSSLVYSTYLGGDGNLFGNFGFDIAVTAAGVAFVVGQTDAPDFPTKSSSSLPPLKASLSGALDGFVAKYSPSGALIYSTYFGGNADDAINGVVVDSAERAYVIGTTFSSASTFPLKNAFDSTRGGANDAFVAKLNADGTALFYSTFLGGTGADNGNDIAIDAAGNAYVTGTGTRTGFPIVNGFSPALSGAPIGSFVAKIEHSDATGTTTPKLLYSDLVGQVNSRTISIDSKGDVFLAGQVSSPSDFHATPGAFQQTIRGSFDGFVLKISSTFPDTIGVFRSSTGQFLLRNDNSDGAPDITTSFGQPGDLPVAGDWNGDGVDDIGVYRPSTGQFLLRRVGISVICNPTCHVTVGVIIATINFGQSGDLPVVGDWDGDGIDTPGVFRSGVFLLTNSKNINNSSPAADITVLLGQGGDQPLAGDWNGDGIDTIGVFTPSIATFSLSNTFNGTIDITPFIFGSLGSVPLVGDWNGDGIDTIGTFQANIGTMTLNNTNTSGNGVGDLVFNFGQSGDLPVAGDWDGKP